MLTTKCLPKTQIAIVQDSAGQPKMVRDAPVPALKGGTVLIKTVAVALNPSDYKMGKAFPTPGAVIGMDFSGSVVAIHPHTNTNLKVGDSVCGIVHGSNPAEPSCGSFAEYIAAPVEYVLRVPDTLPLKEASGLGCALLTSAVALWSPDALALTVSPKSPASVSEAANRPVLVYGGSTASGTMAIQLLKLSGLTPIATASTHNFELVKSFGASAVFDSGRGFPPLGADKLGAVINKHTDGRLRHALDCIADQASTTCCYAALGRPGGRYASLEATKPSWRTRSIVKSHFVMSLEGLGNEVQLGGEYGRASNASLRELVIDTFSIFQDLLNNNRLKVHPVKVAGHGWEALLDGLYQISSSSVSCEKLVVELD